MPAYSRVSPQTSRIFSGIARVFFPMHRKESVASGGHSPARRGRNDVVDQRGVAKRHAATERGDAAARNNAPIAADRAVGNRHSVRSMQPAHSRGCLAEGQHFKWRRNRVSLTPRINLSYLPISCSSSFRVAYNSRFDQ